MYHAEITGWGMCVPPARLTNHDLATFLDTSDEWIVSRSGIRERRVSHVNFSELGLVSARRALAAADVDPADLDLIMLASLTNDSYCPNTASIIQDELGAPRAGALDINTACTGFLYGMHLCRGLIATGQHKKILLIGGEFITHYLNWSQRSSAILFGDACGAVVLEPSEKPVGLLASRIGCEADAKEAIQITNFGSAYERLTDDFLYVKWNFDGREVFKRAVKSMAQACVDVLDEAGVDISEVAVVVPHQANKRILDALAARIGVPEEKVIINVDRYGNTSAGTIPVALVEALEQGRIKPGDYVLSAAFGGGLTWAAGLFRWGDRVTPLKTSDAELPPCDKTALELLAPHIKRYQEYAEREKATEIREQSC
ncbi:MAG: ketoacyl-ACP synthase III [Gammaproteobacteria bacterium]|nr:ketoacyl-ACP synthase III [Gammaproteobacteria bacterium]MYK04872.1 ketoacyl-ACP synthase III [Gammaproteobacteria bacterium]